MKTSNADEIDMVIETDDSDGLTGNPIFALPVTLTVSVGCARMTVEQLLSLDPETIVELDSATDASVKLLVGDHLFALGDLIETETGSLGVRITEFGKNR